jgi:hypothetical protein
VPWQERGVEDLAEVITAVVVSCSDGDPDLVAFDLITGGQSQCDRQADEQPIEVRSTKDPLDADVSWDQLR